MELVLTEWDGDDGEWVRAADAIKREAELLARVHELEDRAAKAAALVAEAARLCQSGDRFLGGKGKDAPSTTD
ncbi:hypothetical protein DIE10_06605 [Burkholderia sp. Bp9011]|nr:hypothetical protein DIE10_06605 [Burkholderia sp. Bp9011]